MDPEASVVWRALCRRGENGHKIKHRALEGLKRLKFRSFMETQVGGQGASLSFPVSQEKKPRLWEVKWLAQGWSCRVVHLGSEHRVSASRSLIHCVASKKNTNKQTKNKKQTKKTKQPKNKQPKKSYHSIKLWLDPRKESRLFSWNFLCFFWMHWSLLSELTVKETWIKILQAGRRASLKSLRCKEPPFSHSAA